MARLHGAGVPRIRVDPRSPRHDRVRLRRPGLPARCPRRARRSPAGNDDPDQSGHRCRIRRQLGRRPGRLRGRGVVGAVDADHGHEPRPLARDAFDHASPRCPECPGRAAPGYRRARNRVRCRDSAVERDARRRCRPRASWGARPRRRRDPRGRCGRRRIDDHRRVAAGQQGAGRQGCGRHDRRWRQPARAGHRHR